MSEDERYFTFKGRKWRRTDPSIPDSLRQELVNELMGARRAVKTALSLDDSMLLKVARLRVSDAKNALGERGEPWWKPQSDEDIIKRLTATILALLRSRKDGSSICPSEAARVVGGTKWRDLMSVVKDVGISLADQDKIMVTQGGVRVNKKIVGPYRFALNNSKGDV